MTDHSKPNSRSVWRICGGLLHLPADSPVLIQSGFAMLAMAKISAARNRHPEMIVSLSMPPAEEALTDVGKCRSVQTGSPERGKTQGCECVCVCGGGAAISLTSPPSTATARCCGSAGHPAATLAPFQSSQREPPATKKIKK